MAKKETKKVIRKMDLAFLNKIGQELEEILEPTNEDGESISLSDNKKLATAKKKIMEACESLTTEDEISEDLEWALAEFGMELTEPGGEDDEDDDTEDDEDGEDDEDDDTEDDEDGEDDDQSLEDQIRGGKLADLKLIVQEDNTFKKLRKFAKTAKGLEGTRELKGKMLAAIGIDPSKTKTKTKTKTDSSKKRTDGPSNKEIVYKQWIKKKNTPIEKLLELVKERVQVSTIKNWINQWEKGNNLPAIAKNKE